jgi:formylmethanofuran dehydrogenase subunit E
MGKLGVERSSDEELVLVAETDACGADAIQVMTGCTFGKGNFFFRDYGKNAFSLFDRRKGAGFRVCLRPKVLETDSEFAGLSEKVRGNKASKMEIERLRELQKERVEKILTADGDTLFKTDRVSEEIPPRAGISKSEVCGTCGEPFKADLTRIIDGKHTCVPCAKIKAREDLEGFLNG